MLDIMGIIFFPNNDRLNRSQFLVFNTEDMLQEFISKIILGCIHLVFISVHFIGNLKNLIDLFDPAHHVDEISEEGFGSLELEFVFVATSTFVADLGLAWRSIGLLVLIHT